MFKYSELPIYRVVWLTKFEIEEHECFGSFQAAVDFASIVEGGVFKNYEQKEDGSYVVYPVHDSYKGQQVGGI